MAEAVFGVASSRVSFARLARRDDVRNGSASGLIDRWTFKGLQPAGPDRGDLSVTARLNEIKFVSVEDNQGVSPLAYMEARRTGGLDASTTQSLDPQLERIDPALSTLRPRFAAPAP
jgi:hypothetical protein